MKEISMTDLIFYIDKEKYLNVKIGDKKIKSKTPLTLNTNIKEELKNTLTANKYRLRKETEDVVFVISFYAYGDDEYLNSKNKYNHLQENKSYLIKHPVDVISKSILKNWEDRKKQNIIDKKDISKIISGKPNACLYTKPMNEFDGEKIIEPKDFIYEDGSTAYENELSILKISANEVKVNYTANWGQKSVIHYYKIDTLQTDNVVYVPVEVKKTGRYTDYILLDGIYGDYQSAKKILSKQKKADKTYTILIKDSVDIVHQEWYKNLFQREK